MTTSNSAAELPTKIQGLLDKRGEHVAAIDQIDKMLAGVSTALGTSPQMKTATIVQDAAVTKGPVIIRVKSRKRGAYQVSATDLVLAFVMAKGSPTSKEIGEHLISEGRSAGATSSALSVLTSAKKLKRKSLGNGKVGSTYSLV